MKKINVVIVGDSSKISEAINEFRLKRIGKILSEYPIQNQDEIIKTVISE